MFFDPRRAVESRSERTPIALVGMPGGGKSTVSRQLAKRLGWQFADSDALAENELGCSIRTFFEREGEGRFRDVEAELIAKLALASNIVIATGGGAVLREETRRLLRTDCHVIYLRSTPEELFRRLRGDSHRPLLQVADPLARLRELFEVRDPLYRETAHFVVDTGRPTVATLVNMVLMQLELAGVIDAGLVPSSVEPPHSTN